MFLVQDLTYIRDYLGQGAILDHFKCLALAHSMLNTREEKKILENKAKLKHIMILNIK